MARLHNMILPTLAQSYIETEGIAEEDRSVQMQCPCCPKLQVDLNALMEFHGFKGRLIIRLPPFFFCRKLLNMPRAVPLFQEVLVSRKQKTGVPTTYAYDLKSTRIAWAMELKGDGGPLSGVLVLGLLLPEVCFVRWCLSAATWFALHLHIYISLSIYLSIHIYIHTHISLSRRSSFDFLLIFFLVCCITVSVTCCLLEPICSTCSKNQHPRRGYPWLGSAFDRSVQHLCFSRAPCPLARYSAMGEVMQE